MNKKGFVDVEVVTSLGFIILVVMALGATIIGWKVSAGMTEDGTGWPIWQIGLIMIVEVIGCYFFAARG